MQGFPPIADCHTRILVLGSFPSVKSLQEQMYYGHPQNQFWKIMGVLLDEPLEDLSYKERCARLKRHKVGIWDVYRSCEREGSLDSNIRRPQLNDFRWLERNCPHIERILFNGKTAFKHAKRVPLDVPKYAVPSTSPANTKCKEQKLEEWHKAFRG